MERDSRPKTGNGRALVAAVLAVIGVFFALDAVVFEPSAARVVFIVLAVLMIGGAGAALAASLAARRKS